MVFLHYPVASCDTTHSSGGAFCTPHTGKDGLPHGTAVVFCRTRLAPRTACLRRAHAPNIVRTLQFCGMSINILGHVIAHSYAPHVCLDLAPLPPSREPRFAFLATPTTHATAPQGGGEHSAIKKNAPSLGSFYCWISLLQHFPKPHTGRCAAQKLLTCQAPAVYFWLVGVGWTVALFTFCADLVWFPTLL